MCDAIVNIWHTTRLAFKAIRTQYTAATPHTISDRQQQKSASNTTNTTVVGTLSARWCDNFANGNRRCASRRGDSYCQHANFVEINIYAHTVTHILIYLIHVGPENNSCKIVYKRSSHLKYPLCRIIIIIIWNVRGFINISLTPCDWVNIE